VNEPVKVQSKRVIAPIEERDIDYHKMIFEKRSYTPLHM